MNENDGKQDQESKQDQAPATGLGPATKLFKIHEVSLMLGGMPESSIRKFVRDGKLKRCLHLGSRPWYFTYEQIQSFIINKKDL